MSSEEGSYIAGEWVCGFCLKWKLYIKNTLEPANVCLKIIAFSRDLIFTVFADQQPSANIVQQTFSCFIT